MRKAILSFIAAALFFPLFASDVYSWGSQLDFSQVKGGSDLNVANAIEVMSMETACAFDDMAHAYGFRPSFHRRELFYDLAGDFLEENGDGTISIIYRNGHRAEADLKWPLKSTLVSYLPLPDNAKAKVEYTVYDDSALVIGFAMLDKDYAAEYAAILEKLFALDIVRYLNPLYFSGRNGDGMRVHLSLEDRLLVLEKVSD